MARDLRVRARIEAENAASPAVREAQGAFEGLSNFLRDRFVITLGDVVRATQAVFNAFRSVIDASAEEEAAVNRLNAALAVLGPNADRVSQALQDQATALQQTTAFSDDAILAGQALAATFTRSEAELKAITQAAVDLAATGRIDLAGAFNLLGRAAAGSTETLTRYGVRIDESVPKSERFAESLRQLNQQTGGQAAAQLGTFSGSIAQLGNAFAETLQILGDAVVKNEEFRAAVQALSAALGSEGFIRVVTQIATTIATLVAAIANGIAQIETFARVTADTLGPLTQFVRLLVPAPIEDFAASLGRGAAEMVRTAAAANQGADAAGDLAKQIEEARAAQERQIAAARAAPDPIRAVEERMRELAALAGEATAAQEAYVASLEDTATAARDAAAATDELAASEEGATAAATEGATSSGIVGGIRTVSTRRRTAEDTEAALLARNIEALRRSGFTQPGQILALQRRLAALQAADFGGVDDTRSIA